MPKVSSDAIVLRSVDFSESSLVLTLLTREYGKIHAIAKGARRLKNPFESALDLLAQINVSFIRKSGEVLDLLTEAKLQARFRPDRTTIQALNAGYYLAELLDLTTADGDPMPELYDLAAETLNRYQRDDRTADAREYFEWNFLDLIGQKPSIRLCANCGARLELETLRDRGNWILLSFLDGGVICPACRVRGTFTQTALFHPDVFLRLERLDTGEPIPSIETIAQNIQGGVRELFDLDFCHILSRRPKTQPLARQWLKSQRSW